MLKEITLNAEQELIQKAILVAQRQKTTLEAAFRQWLNRYIQQNQPIDNYTKLMNELSDVQVGRTFSRDELNER
ncbi:hypothetical protein QUF54_07995 [Candidatus Marithioploca araucensis]|uniref:Uncharacterized protein n=1 Tax=Candidatus Marithioploca araucensis TaxID=70273 RepID=A0ABT7VUM2_9GAMM|nr:hypothetical protein [Candidatus Marithioploca araucensis]